MTKDRSEINATGAHVLIVDDDAASRRLLQVRLRALGCDLSLAADGEEALRAIQKDVPELVLLDLEMPRMDGISVLRRLREDEISTPVIVITAHGSIERAVAAMKEGAYDFITKPFDPEHLEIVVRKALERHGLTRDLSLLSEEVDKRYQLIVGKSQNMTDAAEIARKAAASKATVLLLGESGTGKEIFARAIHNWSERSSRPFVAINCVGLSKELLESELFGHEKGAFTGADQLKKGKMELANGGTVFLDEIGDVSSELQTKLLRFLQEREFERVGGTKTVHVDIRIIAATNCDLDAAVREERFREDLYHRLNVISLTLPPLRERTEDISPLARYFLRRYSLEAKKGFSGIAEEAVAKLSAYDWPGNVRELVNVIERAVVLGDGPELTVKDLPGRIFSAQPRVNSGKLSYRDTLEATRRELVVKALEDSQGNRAAAAKSLGLHEKYLLRLIKTLGIN